MAFYKLHKDEIYEAPNAVFSPVVTLKKESKDTYTYPADGWYWFDTIEEAYLFFNKPYPPVEEESQPE